MNFWEGYSKRYYCELCHKIINGASPLGYFMHPDEYVVYTKEKYNRVLCWRCVLKVPKLKVNEDFEF